jgi:hypothetical protein
MTTVAKLRPLILLVLLAILARTEAFGFSSSAASGGGLLFRWNMQPLATAGSRRMPTMMAALSSRTAASSGVGVRGESGGIYRPFAEYAWTRFAEKGLLSPTASIGGTVPEELRANSSPAKGPKGGTPAEVRIRVDSRPGRDGDGKSAIRLARFALLETVAATADDHDAPAGSGVEGSESVIHGGGGAGIPGATHVLNLVVFPNAHLGFCEALPVLGLDLVTLPGNRHLVAMDLQPVLPPPENDETGRSDDGRNTNPNVIPERYRDIEERLKLLHKKHCVESEALPWGGDVPPFAQRYFSPYAVWTRPGGPGSKAKNEGGGGGCGDSESAPSRDPLGIVQSEVWEAFQDYVDLYIELMERVQQDIDRGEPTIATESAADEGKEVGNVALAREAVKGQRDYLNFRKEKDPARPMLKGLYGEEWTERLIGDVLFPMIPMI